MNDDDIKILEELLNQKYDDELLNTLETISKEDEVYILTIFEKQAIKNLLKENEELSEENAILKRANNISEDVKIEDITNFINKSIEDFNKEYIPVAKIKEEYERNKAKTDCRYCNNSCDSYAICMFCKELLEEK